MICDIIQFDFVKPNIEFSEEEKMIRGADNYAAERLPTYMKSEKDKSQESEAIVNAMLVEHGISVINNLQPSKVNYNFIERRIPELEKQLKTRSNDKYAAMMLNSYKSAMQDKEFLEQSKKDVLKSFELCDLIHESIA